MDRKIRNFYILGISCFYHDSAAALIKNGEIIAAAQEERFTRVKHDASFPINAINYCLNEADIHPEDIDYIVFYENPFLKFERILFTNIATFPKSLQQFLLATKSWIKEKLWVESIIRERLDYDGEVLFGKHHLSHMASAFYTSPFKKSAILTMDGVGEWATASYGIGKDNKIEIIKEMRFPHSLGLLYSAFTYYLGFKINNGEYKVMGLAPYGKPRYYDRIMNELIDLKSDGSIQLNLKYFAFHYGLKMINRRFAVLFGGPSRKPDEPFTERHKDIAASIQKATETIVLKMADYVYQETKIKNLCLAGGVALNSVANGKLLKKSRFDNIYVQPAATDAGGALGAALSVWYNTLKNKRIYMGRENIYLGPSFTDEEIVSVLKQYPVKYEKYTPDQLVKRTAKLLADGRIVGWFQGRMEWGPRALGNRSILADPRRAEMKDKINKYVKHREAFRPFAPAVLSEYAEEYFEIDRESPWMLFTVPVKKEKQKKIPAVVHIDGSARVQTVSEKDNPLFHQLLKEFYKITGIPVLLNTSFNIKGQPIVCSPEDAINTFLKTGLDILVINNYICRKGDK